MKKCSSNDRVTYEEGGSMVSVYFLCVGVIQHRRLYTALHVQCTSPSPLGLCARTQFNEVVSCWNRGYSFRVSRARCGSIWFQRMAVGHDSYRHMAESCFVSNSERKILSRFWFVFCSTE